MESQIISAVQIAADPHQDRSLQAQAVEFLNVVRGNARQSSAVALALFLEQNPDGSRKHDTHVRLFALQLLDDFLDSGIEPLESNAFQALEQSFIQYIQSEYIQGAVEASAPYIRNKFSHTLALLFVRSYPDQWGNFFPTIYSLLRPEASASSSSGLPPINPHVSVLFLRLLIEISGEVHDQTLKGARAWSVERQNRDGHLRHRIREEEAKNMNTVVLTIISEADERLSQARQQPQRSAEQNGLEEVITLGVKAFAGYCQWVDINLTVNESTVPLIFRLLGDQSSPIRQATSHALLRIITKGLNTPVDKLQLVRVLSLNEVLQALEAKSRENRRGLTGPAQEAEETYRESLGKLTCGLAMELVELSCAEGLPPEGRDLAEQFLVQLLPVCIEFLADEYDDTSSTIFPAFTGVFNSYKKAKKLNPQGHLTDAKRHFLTSTLKVLVDKLKWDSDIGQDEDDLEDMDEEDRGAFEKTRHELRSLMDAIITIDDDLVSDAVRTIAISTLSAYENAGGASAGNLTWQDAELAVYLVYLYGELRPKGKFAFVVMPPDLEADKQKRKTSDAAELPLTPHGELMFALVKSGISSFPHVAVRSQFFETVSRYLEFFRVRKVCIPPILEALVDARGMHQPRKNRRGRVFYIFHRFIKEVRNDIPRELIPTLLESIQDLLVLEIELPAPESENRSNSSAGSSPTPDQDANSILEEAVKTPGLFDNQLYLFETTGTMISLLTGEDDSQQVAVLEAVSSRLLNDLSQALQTPMRDAKDVLPVYKTHHYMQALASVVKGFPDAPSTTSGDAPKRLSVFRQIAEAMLLSLEAMKQFKVIRDATRFAFTRIISAAGPSVAQYIPRLTARLLSTDIEPSELVELFSYLGLVFHRHLGEEVLLMLDPLITLLRTKVASVLSQPVDGTDTKQMRDETKRAYLEFISVIMSGPLYTVFISPQNAPEFPSLVNSIIDLAADTSHPPTQRSAFIILGRFILHFGAPEGTTIVIKNWTKQSSTEEIPSHYLPGFETVIYEKLIPLAFDVPVSAGFNVKDGQSIQVLGEIGIMLKAAHKARGQEALDFLGGTFLPSRSCPPQTTVEFVGKLAGSDAKEFKKYFVDFIRALTRPRVNGSS